MESFLTLSECLYGTFPRNLQGTFTEVSSPDYPIFAHHPQFMHTILKFIYSRLFHVLRNNDEHVHWQKIEILLTLTGFKDKIR